MVGKVDGSVQGRFGWTCAVHGFSGTSETERISWMLLQIFLKFSGLCSLKSVTASVKSERNLPK